MKDVQKEKSSIPLSIEKVGIKEISYPIRVLKKDNSIQHTIAKLNLAVELPANIRGTHMSRFIELIEKHKQDINGQSINQIIKDIAKVFDAKKGYIEITFPFFIEKRAPVSRRSSIMQTICGYKNNIDNNKIETSLIVKVTVTTLCPCSKEISKYGAHNQKAFINLEIGEKEFIWFEDIIDTVEQCASAPIYPLLKREDEKFVTEQAYDNPRFVEDLVREVYKKLLEKYKDRITRIKIEVESDESIHQHKAYAIIEKVI